MKDQPKKRSQKSSAAKSPTTRALPPVLACLASEHKHMAALTRLLEVRAEQKQKFQQADYFLMRDVVAYLHDYPDQVHHPTEDLLFERLSRLRPDLGEEVRALQSQHRQLAEQGGRLLAQLEQAADGVPGLPEKDLRISIREFAGQQNRHMQRENSKLFPAAIAGLRQTDWQFIARRVKLHEDPLFGQEVQARHRTLFEYLLGAEREFASNILAGSLGLQERLLVAASAVEEGSREGMQVLGRAAGQWLNETRALLVGERRPGSLGQWLVAPWRYGWFTAGTIKDCGIDLLGISATTTREAIGAALRQTRE